jgi:hypothetical protein
VQQGKQPFWVRLQLLARLTLNAGKHAGNEPARLAQLDDGNDRAILVQGDEGSAQSLPWRKPGSFGWGIADSIGYMQRRSCHPRRLPHSVSRSLWPVDCHIMADQVRWPLFVPDLPERTAHQRDDFLLNLRIVQQAQKRLFESLVFLGLLDLVFSFGSIVHSTMMT